MVPSLFFPHGPALAGVGVGGQARPGVGFATRCGAATETLPGQGWSQQSWRRGSLERQAGTEAGPRRTCHTPGSGAVCT